MMLAHRDLFEGLFEALPTLLERPLWPAFDISEDETAVTLEADVPGMAESEIRVAIENGVLTVSGEKKFAEKKTAHRVERRYGSFSRSFNLPDGLDVEKVKAASKNGVLTLTLPKNEAAQPRRIDVKVG